MHKSTPAVQFTLQADERLLAVAWQPNISSQELRAAYRTVLRYLASNQISCVLFELANPATISPVDETWVATEFMPSLLPYTRQGKPPRIAYVLQPESYQQLLEDSPSTRVANFGELIALQYFPERQPALAWLRQSAA